MKEPNHEKYLINKSVVFDTNKNEIWKLVSGDKRSLYIPASRCLAYLIKNKRKVTHRNELMQVGWKEHGLNVTNNAYYQNISNIRKGLRDLLPDVAIIITIKSKGITIGDNVSITPFEPDNVTELKDEQFDKKSMRLIYPLKKPVIITSIWIVSIFFCAYVLYDARQGKIDYFVNYRLLSEKRDCSIYINHDVNRSTIDVENVNKEFDCKGFKKLYITAWDNWRKRSIIYCSPVTNKKKGEHCISEYFGKKTDEN